MVLASLIVAAVLPAAAAPLETALAEMRAHDAAYFADGSTVTLRDYGRRLEAVERESLRPLAARARTLDDASVGKLFDALQAVAFYSESPAPVREMLRLFPEIERRKLATPELLKDFNDVCLLTHQDCGLAGRFAGLAKIPSLKGSPAGESARVLDFSDDGSATAIRRLAWSKGARILLLTSPSCNPGRLAAADIEADPALREVFARRAFLISPAGDVSSVSETMAWNRKHPTLRIQVAYSLADWPMFDRWKTPTFVFLKDGKPLYQFGSWTHPDENGEHRAKLLHGLELIGLAPKN